MYENDGGLLSPRDAYRLMLKDYPDVMDIGQMCEALGVSTKTGYKLLKDGKIEYLKIGRAYRIPKAHIPVSYTHLDVYKRQALDRGY